MKQLSQRTELVTPSPIRNMFNRALGMQDVISFTVGEPDFNTPDHIVNAAIDALQRGEHHYTPNAGILPLRKAIASSIQNSHNLLYDPMSQIIVTNGGMEALYLAMLCLLDSGDELILTDPCWTNYSRQVLLCGGIPKFIPVSPLTDFQFDPDKLEKTISSRTKVLLINSPSNPTGGIASPERLEKIAQIAVRHDLFVITDEVYTRLVYDGGKAQSIAAFPGMQERTVLINSFSKTYAMTGWRVGFALGPKSIIMNMIKFQENVCACVNSSAQFGAIAALEGPQEPVETMLSVYAQRRKLLLQCFANIPGISCYAPEGAFYALLDIEGTGMSSDVFAMDLLEKARVIVVPGKAFGNTSDHYVRLSFATSEENILEGAKRIKEYREKHL